MNDNYLAHIDKDFAADSRVWIYQSDRPFRPGEQSEIKGLIQEFATTWKSHGHPVKGTGYLIFDRFIVIMADERATGVSGCSTDSSVRMIKAIEQSFGVNMFERTNLALKINGEIQLVPLPELQSAIDKGIITGETIYFNNLVPTKEEWEKNWMVPVKKSWLASRIKLVEQ